MRPTWCPETSVSIYHYMFPNTPQERISHLHPCGSLQLLSHRSVCNKCLLLLNTTAVNNSSYAYSQRRITSNATGVVRLCVEQCSSGAAAPRCIVFCSTSSGRRTSLNTSTRTTLHKQLVSILTTCL